MKYAKDFKRLGLPENFKFGIEIEAFNVKTAGKNSLYTGKSAEYIKNKNWNMVSGRDEILVYEGGAEVTSPILKDTEQTWKDVSDICVHIKKYPGNKGKEVVADSKCGLHIHFDADCLAQDQNKMRNFMRLYAESEELLYKMCNDKNDPIRANAINRNLKGINIISSPFISGMASPTGKKILRQIKNDTLKVSYKKFGKLKMLVNKAKLDNRRYSGLNLTNIGNSKKNTIEFRMANGTLDPEVIKQNVFLYASLINTAIQMTENPDLYRRRLEEFYNTDVTEQQKAENFLNLIMDSQEDRTIYMDRWQSVKDAQVFSKNDKKGFAPNRFKREQFRKIAMRTPSRIVLSAYQQLKYMLNRERITEVHEYGR